MKLRCTWLVVLPLWIVQVYTNCTLPSYPPDRKVTVSSMAVKAKIIEKSERFAELWILYVYKGTEKLSLLSGAAESGLADVSMKNIRLNVTVEGGCSDFLEYNQEYIVLLRRRGRRVFVDPTSGGIVAFTQEADRRIFKILGWNEWTDWSACSAVCAGGEQRRERSCRSGFCSGNNMEHRYCNQFPCKGLVNLLNIDNPEYFKPTRNTFRKIPDRTTGWRLKSSSYLLYSFKDAFGYSFPREFSLFLNFKPYTNTTGVLLSMTDPRNKAEFISIELTTILGQKRLGVKLIHSTNNGSRVVAIPVDIQYNEWNYLALSIGDRSTVKSYLNCNWVTTQILQGNPILPHQNPDIALGYLFQGEIEQASVSESPEDVSEHCSSTEVSSDNISVEPDYSDEEVVEITKREYEHHHSDIHLDHIEDEDNHDGSGDVPHLVQDQDDSVDEGSGGFLLEWSSWSPCSSSCGHATQTRWSRCLDSERMMECIESGLERKIIRSCSLPSCQVPEVTSRHITPEDIQHFRDVLNSSINQLAENHTSHNSYQDKPSCSCSLHGTCSESDSRCICDDGWTGSSCSTPVCTQGCVQGTCVQPDICACAKGYTGSSCQTAMCHPECENGGQCVAPFTCKCRPGYRGKHCQKDMCRQKCKNGGTCIGQNVCSCPHGYSGSDCGDFTCTQRCLNGGVCTAPDLCTCTKGYKGDRCQDRECSHFVRTKVPVRKAYKRVVSVSGNEESSEPVYRTFYRTYYKTVVRCFIPSSPMD